MSIPTANSPGLSSGLLIDLVHQAAPGRVRIKVFGLYRHARVKQELEKKIGQIAYVGSAKANTLTSTVLILFDPSVAAVPDLLADLVSLVGPLRHPVPPGASSTPAVDRAATARASESPIKQWLRRFSPRASQKESVVAPAAKKPAGRSIMGHSAASKRATPPESLWFAENPDYVLSILKSSRAGLNAAEANHRLAQYGPNVLSESRRRSGLKLFLQQFFSIPVGMLGASAAIAIATGGFADAIVIAGVVMINAVIGYVTESNAERTINALGKFTPALVRVIREGRETEIPMTDVVVGDVLILTPGSYIPADARLLASNRMTVDESALTGESLPVSKHSDRLCALDSPLGDRLNMVHMGTVVTGGSGLAVVTATGLYSEIGHIQSLVGEVAPPDTPLQRQLDQMGVQLAALSAGICVLVFGIGILRGYGWLQMLSSSISLAVAAVPEGLPAVATTTLALGIREMQRKHVLIRQLPAVESLGSVQVLCLDKTGTLTMNEMKVVAIHTLQQDIDLREGVFRVDDEPSDVLQDEVMRLLEVVTLCSEVKIQTGGDAASDLEGSPTESALVEAALHAGINAEALRARLPLIKTLHRAENRPYMLTFHRDKDGRYLLAIKGSPAEVLSLCGHRQLADACQALDDEVRQRVMERNDQMATDALRVLGVAYGYADTLELSVPENLVWLGLIGMEDIIRPGVQELIAQFHDAGIETVMITGDQSATAYSVGKRLGLNHRKSLEIVDSVSLDKLEPEILASIIRDTSIFARVSPAHKLKIVQALQKTGRVVAMTGDGINDGPALKAADVGVAMGKRGTDVARSVADVVLEDDNLHTMITAVEQGRSIYGNIRKSLRFLLSTNLSEIEVMLVTTALGMGEALNPIQLLWINLMTDIFPALALAMEPPERDVLKQPPRDPQEPIVRRQDIAKLLKESSLITAGSIGVYGYSLARYGAGNLQASTNTFMTLTLAQFFHSIACRSEETTILSRDRPDNPYLKMAILGSLGVQALTVLVPPLRRILRLSPLAVTDLLVILAGAGLPFLVNEGTKTLRLIKEEDAEKP